MLARRCPFLHALAQPQRTCDLRTWHQAGGYCRKQCCFEGQIPACRTFICCAVPAENRQIRKNLLPVFIAHLSTRMNYPNNPQLTAIAYINMLGPKAVQTPRQFPSMMVTAMVMDHGNVTCSSIIYGSANLAGDCLKNLDARSCFLPRGGECGDKP